MAKGTQTARAPSKTPAQTQSPKPGTAVATKKSGEVADPELLKMMGDDSGRGVSTASEDNIVPLLYVLQSNSPQLDRADKVKHLKGAKSGDIWLRGTPTFLDGEEDGIEVIPCHFSKCWIEWRPDRGGFAGRHKDKPAAAKQVTIEAQSGDEKTVWQMPNGNTVVETREHVVIVTSLEKPTTLVIPMTSTNHTASKEWMGLMNNVLIPGTDKTAPSYGYVYRLRTIPRKNEKGSWYMWQASHAGEEDGSAVPQMVTDMSLYKAAKKINADFTSGALRADDGEPETETETTTDM